LLPQRKTINHRRKKEEKGATLLEKNFLALIA
jgi:hypothetical protein